MTEAEPKPASSAARIPMSEIVASKTNPRTSFTAPDIAELAASIKKHGIFQPLLLRLHPSASTPCSRSATQRDGLAAGEEGRRRMSHPRTRHACTGCQAVFMAVAARLCPECCTKLRRKPAMYVWTPEKDDYLRANYDGRVKGRAAEIAAQFSWPRWVVRRRATDLGLSRMSPREMAWTPAEDAILDRWAGRRSVKWISLQLPGRTLTAVVMRFKRRQISQSVDGYTARSLALCMGVDNRTILRWVNERRLKPTEQGVFREANWLFTHASVRSFVKNNPTAFRLDKVDQIWFLDLVFGGSAFREREVAA